MKVADVIMWAPLFRVQASVESSIAAFERMIDFDENNLEISRGKISETIDDIRENYQNDSLGLIVESMYHESEHRILNLYKDILWGSIVVSQIMLLESTLKIIADLVDNHSLSVKKIGYKKSNRITSYHNALKERFFREDLLMATNFNPLSDAIDIRNWLVHEDYRNFESRKKVLNFYPSIKVIMIENKVDKIIVQDASYPKQLNKAIKTYLTGVIKSVYALVRLQGKALPVDL